MIARTYEDIVKIAERHIPIIISLIVATVLLLLVGISLRTIVFMPIFFLVAAFSTYYKRYMQMPTTFELVSVTTVAVGIVYGPWAGAIFGTATGLAAELISGGIDAFIPVNMFARFLMGFLAGIISGDFVILGMALTLLFTVIVQAPYLFYGDPQDKVRTLFFSGISLFVNFTVFSILGEIVLDLIN